MSTLAQQKAIKDHRKRLAQQGIVRFEVQALKADRDLIRAMAKRLAEGGVDAEQFRADIRRSFAGEQSAKGGILAALRRAPDAFADLDLTRERDEGRPVNL